MTGSGSSTADEYAAEASRSSPASSEASPAAIASRPAINSDSLPRKHVCREMIQRGRDEVPPVRIDREDELILSAHLVEIKHIRHVRAARRIDDQTRRL